MNTKAIYTTFFLILSLLKLEADEPNFNLQQIKADQDQISAQIRADYPNFNEAEPANKIIQFSSILNQVGSSVYSKAWNYSGNASLPIVDWNQVDKIGSFEEDQDKLIINNDLVIILLDNQTNNEAARLRTMASLINHYCLEGRNWFGDWIQAKAKANDDNLKWLVYRCADNFSENYYNSTKTVPGDELAVDWAAWKATFDQSNKLGKAILLKCMTRLAITTDSWEKVREIHLSVFNGNDDDLKAIALVKGNSKLGDAVIAKWNDLAENSTNLKLKSLAQQAIAKYTGEVEDLE